MTAVREALCKQVSEILSAALSGRDERYRTEDRFVRWGRVEDDIHEAIRRAALAQEPAVAVPREVTCPHCGMPFEVDP